MSQVYMQPSGYLSCSGISATTPFLKRFLERFNIKAYFFTRERFKNVANQFTHVRPLLMPASSTAYLMSQLT